MQAGQVDFRAGIPVGDRGRVVDLIAFPRGNAGKAVGLVDLSGFGSEPDVGRKVVDYYFQLRRVTPPIEPVFVFPYEAIDENGQTFQSLMRRERKLSAGLCVEPDVRHAVGRESTQFAALDRILRDAALGHLMCPATNELTPRRFQAAGTDHRQPLLFAESQL